MRKKLIIYFLILILPGLLIVYLYFYFISNLAVADINQLNSKPAHPINNNQPVNNPEQPPLTQSQATTTINQPPITDNLPPQTQENNILLDVPFTSQAPFGNWRDAKEQNGCEETSALMAVYWARQKKLTPIIALKEIIAISDYEQKTYNNYYDTSAADTVKRIFNGYFNFKNATVKVPMSADDIISELKNGNLVIAPANGRKLGNPYYTQPGPLEHNLVIKGYDFNTDEFITNDAGTRRGNGLRYKKQVLWQALRDYPTGNKEPIKQIKKTMIVIRPE